MNAPVTSATVLAARLLERHSPEQITLAVETMLAVLDYLDGDPEAEEACLEDSFQDHLGDRPGCELSDGASDVAWVEWDQRKGKRLIALPEPRPGDVNGHLASEDDEEDDPQGACDEDEISTSLWQKKIDYGPGCLISDSDLEHDGREQFGARFLTPYIASLDAPS